MDYLHADPTVRRAPESVRSRPVRPYLHRGGAIAASGALDGVSVDLPPALSRVRLPAPPTGDELRRAVAASLSLVDVAEGGVGAVLFATAYRAPLGAADFSIHLAGPTGVFKTELAALVAQHFGAEQTARYCAASWSGTANANEALAFHCKDAPLVVDDFAPSGAAGDVQRIHREADRLLRAQGNGSLSSSRDSRHPHREPARG